MRKKKPLLAKLSTLNRGLAILIDPEKAMNKVQFTRQLDAICAISPEFIFIGGSTVNAEQMSQTIDLIKATTSIPLIIFPGGTSQLNTSADGLLFLSLISGRNPTYLIGQQVEAAEQLFESNMEIISTGYILVDELGQKSKKRVIMFANKNKSKENSPDFIVYLSNENEEQAKPVTQTAAPVKKPAKVPVAVADDDGIPDDMV